MSRLFLSIYRGDRRRWPQEGDHDKKGSRQYKERDNDDKTLIRIASLRCAFLICFVSHLGPLFIFISVFDVRYLPAVLCYRALRYNMYGVKILLNRLLSNPMVLFPYLDIIHTNIETRKGKGKEVAFILTMSRTMVSATPANL